MLINQVLSGGDTSIYLTCQYKHHEGSHVHICLSYLYIDQGKIVWNKRYAAEDAEKLILASQHFNSYIKIKLN